MLCDADDSMTFASVSIGATRWTRDALGLWRYFRLRSIAEIVSFVVIITVAVVLHDITL